jgi:hypothetical protein
VGSLAVALDLNRQRTDFIAAVHRLKQVLPSSRALITPTAKPSPAPTVSTTFSTLMASTVPCSPLALLNQAPSQPVLMTALTPRER